MTIIGYIDNTNNLMLALFFQNQTSRKDFERYNYIVEYTILVKHLNNDIVLILFNFSYINCHNLF